MRKRAQEEAIESRGVRNLTGKGALRDQSLHLATLYDGVQDHVGPDSGAAF
jgi:hypothetical protein